MDMFSYLLAKNKQDRKYDLTNIRNVINMTDADITNQTPFADYPQDLYNGYINVLKDKYTLIDNMNKGTTTGETTDSVNLPIYGGVLTKESTQETTVGKNLFKLPDSETKNGITFTQNIDGTFDISGTAEGSASFQIKLNEALASGTYTLSLNTNLLKVYVQAYQDNTWTANLISLENANKITETITSQGNKTNFLIDISSGTTLNLQNVKIQLESGSEETYWEPYTGGIPAPNPDYPETINVVTGDVDINVVGKNLFDNVYMITNQYKTDGTSATAYTLNNNKITTNVNLDTGRRFLNKLLLKAQTYTLSGDISFSNNTNTRFYYSIRDLNTLTDIVPGTRVLIGSNTGHFVITFSLSSASDSIAFSLQPEGNADGTITMSNIQLEVGTESTSYVPYQGGTYQISLGTNEIVGIGDIKDELVIDKEGNCSINKKIVKVVLDGTEGHAFMQLSSSNNNRAQIQENNALANTNYNNQSLKCNYFKYEPSVYRDAGDDVGCVQFNKALYFRFGSLSDINTLAKANQWLSTHNTVVYYILEEPTVIDLEQTVDITTCDGITTITNSENMDMNITYIKNTYN